MRFAQQTGQDVPDWHVNRSLYVDVGSAVCLRTSDSDQGSPSGEPLVGG